jgi:hypothetical protein
MDLAAATPEQIEAFQKGAQARYGERKVSPEVASTLFGAFMNKAAMEMGFMPFDQAARIDSAATKIASALGRKRPAPAQ